jgi:Cyclic nucleotide-binding domain
MSLARRSWKACRQRSGTARGAPVLAHGRSLRPAPATLGRRASLPGRPARFLDYCDGYGRSVSEDNGIAPDRIRAIDVFSELSAEELEEVASLARERQYDAGEDLLQQDYRPDDLLALEAGEVEVRRHGQALTKLSGGCVVGERGVVRNALRNADVVALGSVKVLYFPMDKLRTLRRDVPEIDQGLKELAEERET